MMDTKANVSFVSAVPAAPASLAIRRKLVRRHLVLEQSVPAAVHAQVIAELLDLPGVEEAALLAGGSLLRLHYDGALLGPNELSLRLEEMGCAAQAQWLAQAGARFGANCA